LTIAVATVLQLVGLSATTLQVRYCSRPFDGS
jgi:hypothetical protein